MTTKPKTSKRPRPLIDSPRYRKIMVDTAKVALSALPQGDPGQTLAELRRLVDSELPDDFSLGDWVVKLRNGD